MSKLSKGQLKNIVKECLLEILEEGIGGTSGTERVSMTESRPRRKTKPSKKNEKVKGNRLENENFEDAIQKSVQTITENPVMQDILRDTARSTLQEQLSADSGKSGVSSIGGNMDEVGEPIEQFTANDRWAALAFPGA